MLAFTNSSAGTGYCCLQITRLEPPISLVYAVLATLEGITVDDHEIVDKVKKTEKFRKQLNQH